MEGIKMKIVGKQNEAVVFAKVIEEEAIQQIQTLCDQEFAKGSKIRVMPDVHTGKGCTIGMTMTIMDKIVPNIVGVDIGCGMYTVNLGKKEIDLEHLDSVVHKIPSGKAVWDGRKILFYLSNLKIYRMLNDTKRLERSLGTRGGGNHFIEVDTAIDGTKYLIIHSGSRNLGKQVAELYQGLAVDLQKGKEKYFKQKEKMIAKYKEEGKRKELKEELKTLTWTPLPITIPEELCYLYGKYMEDYLADVEICQKFAKINREFMAETIIKEMNLEEVDAFHTIHNYIDVEEMVLRKGAIAAHKGEKVLIPINMRDGSILAVGKGNEEWNQSAPHGAGRVLSRSQAKEKLNIKEYKKQMEGIYSTSVNEATLDEAPMAYKSKEDILDIVKDSVDIIEILKPIYNFKAN